MGSSISQYVRRLKKLNFCSYSLWQPYTFHHTHLFILCFAQKTNVSFTSASICYWFAWVLCLNVALLISHAKRKLRAADDYSYHSVGNSSRTNQVDWDSLLKTAFSQYLNILLRLNVQVKWSDELYMLPPEVMPVLNHTSTVLLPVILYVLVLYFCFEIFYCCSWSLMDAL